MDRLEAMSTLVAAVEAGSLSAASRRLGRPLTTVSRHISQLERHLGMRLLIRSSRRLALTDAGRSYVAACRRILDDVGEAERAAIGEYSMPRGELTLTAPVVFGRLHVLPVASEFLKLYPQINIRMVLADHVMNLFEGSIDLAVRIGDLPDSSLVSTRIGEVRRVVCASPAYLDSRGLPERLEDLAAHDCIAFEGLNAPDNWTFAFGRTRASVPIRSRLVVNTAESAIDAAMSGVGITRVLSYQIAGALRSGKLTVVLEKFEPHPWPVNLVYGHGRPLPLKLRSFVDFTAPRLKTRLAECAV
jgi:DNA-binding transcriptional LysR family regulator